MDPKQDATSEQYGESSADRLLDEGVIVEDDKAPAEYKQFHGQPEVDLEQPGHIYPMVVSAHFADAASADRALDAIGRLPLEREQAIQRFEKEAPEAPGDTNDEGLAPGEVAILIQLDNESLGQQVLEMCEQAGAKHARLYPKQQMGEV